MQGYSRANQTVPALRNLKWIADYLVKCHYNQTAYAVIVSALLTESLYSACQCSKC